MAVVKEWAFKDAKDLVGAMRSKVNQFGYEITLGGGVLVNGSSKNDLDLFFVPKADGQAQLPVDLLMWLASKLGAGKTIMAAIPAAGHVPPGTTMPGVVKSAFTHKMRFDLAGRKIDAFVV